MSTTPPSSALLSPARKRAVLLTASVVSSLVMLDSNIVAVALPTIARSLNADFADVQWVVTAYVLPFAALLLAAGSFGDKIGRRRAALIGLTIFALASLLCGSARSPVMLNAARALQGIGASLLLTAALAIINHSFQGAERARAYGFWGASLGIAITSGPIIGGAISSLLGWPWAFLINLPVCAVLIVATSKVIPESRDPDAKRLDYAGVLLFSSGLFLLTWAVIDGNALGWGASAVLWRAGGGLMLLALFVIAERLQDRPLVDFGLFRSRGFAGSAFAMAGYAAGAQVMIFYLPLYLQNTYGFAPFSAGLAMLPFALPMFLAPRVGAAMAATWSSRGLLCLGLGIMLAADAALGLLAMQGAGYPVFALAMLAGGIGAGLLNGETAKAMQSSLPPERSGMGSGLSATVRFSALLFGVAGLGAVLIGVTEHRFGAVAASLGIDGSQALTLAKRFAAGDAGALGQARPEAVREAAGQALRLAFDAGFGAAAWTAATLAAGALLLTRWLMPAPSPADRRAAPAVLVVPGE